MNIIIFSWQFLYLWYRLLILQRWPELVWLPLVPVLQVRNLHYCFFTCMILVERVLFLKYCLLKQEPLFLLVRFNFLILAMNSFNIEMFNFSGIFTPNDELAKEVAEASEITGEKFWRLPLEESYWESMKSGVADMVNTGGRQGGAITAALFLKQVCTIFSHCIPQFFCQLSYPIPSYVDRRHLCMSF